MKLTFRSADALVDWTLVRLLKWFSWVQPSQQPLLIKHSKSFENFGLMISFSVNSLCDWHFRVSLIRWTCTLASSLNCGPISFFLFLGLNINALFYKSQGVVSIASERVLSCCRMSLSFFIPLSYI